MISEEYISKMSAINIGKESKKIKNKKGDEIWDVYKVEYPFKVGEKRQQKKKKKNLKRKSTCNGNKPLTLIGCISRDLNGCLNQERIFVSYLNIGERPNDLCHPEKEEQVDNKMIQEPIIKVCTTLES